MAGLNCEIRWETRLCEVDGELGYFHCWEHWSNVIDASPLRGGHPGVYKSRRNHKLDEWHTFCDWIEGLPYNELITGPSLKDIPISNEIMEEAKRRVHEELNAQFDHFCKLHEG